MKCLNFIKKFMNSFYFIINLFMNGDNDFRKRFNFLLSFLFFTISTFYRIIEYFNIFKKNFSSSLFSQPFLIFSIYLFNRFKIFLRKQNFPESLHNEEIIDDDNYNQLIYPSNVVFLFHYKR